MVRLTKRDWAEIYYALDTKVRELGNGRFGEETEPRQDARWATHLKKLMRKIGPDGVVAHNKGVRRATV